MVIVRMTGRPFLRADTCRAFPAGHQSTVSNATGTTDVLNRAARTHCAGRAWAGWAELCLRLPACSAVLISYECKNKSVNHDRVQTERSLRRSGPVQLANYGGMGLAEQAPAFRDDPRIDE
jgi:hypothetical protein